MNATSLPTPRQLLQHMEVPSFRGIFILGCLERRVTLYSQQVRALNLAFSLSAEQRLPPGAKVLVIGGGAAGLTFAAGAARLGAKVTLLERRGEVLTTFQGNHTRWLHPHIYEWPRQGSQRENAELPLLNWSAGKAGDVARDLRTQWQDLKEELGIQVFCDAKDIRPISGDDHVHEFAWNAQGFKRGEFSTVVFAVGFGEEIQLPGVTTLPYWKDDELHQYVAPPGNRFLVSGIGDGGIVDLLRLRLRDFQHDQIVRELLSDPELKPVECALLAIEEELHGHNLPDRELYQRYQSLPVPPTLDQSIRARLRGDTHTVLNSPAPYPLRASASILNRFLLSRLLEVDHLEYIQGSITKVEPQEDGIYAVHIGSDKPEVFNRVIVRHGTLPALEQGFPWLWEKDEDAEHLRSINSLDQTREPIWNEQTFTGKPPRVSAGPNARPAPQQPKVPSLIGRQRELEQLVKAILTPEPSPVVVLGPPGIGKSTVALAALTAADIENRYGARRYFAHLDAADTVEAVSASIARPMGLTSVSDLSARVLAALDEGPALLILDNADTPWMKDRSGLEGLLRMLANQPRLALIITLRGKERPDFGGLPSKVVTVPPLTLQESCELFCRIAYNIDPGHPDLPGLLQEMDGVALAVMLLAKQAEGVDLEITRQRWRQEHTAMLRSGSNTSTSLAASIELSLNNPDLPEESRALLSVLALLPAGMAKEDCDSVYPENAAAIAGLQKAALVEHEGKRWRLLGVIRAHVRGSRPPRGADSKKAADFYLSLARRLSSLMGKPSGHKALDQLAEEIDNIEELLLMELEGDGSDTVIETALHLSNFIRFSGRGSARPVEKAREVANKEGATVKEARCLLALSRLYLLRRPKYDKARQYLQEALRLFSREDDGLGVASCLRELGHTAANEYELDPSKEKLEQAEGYFRRALAMQASFEDSVGEAYCLHGLARVASFQNKREEARRLFEETLRMFQTQGDLLGRAYSLRHLGTLEDNDGFLREACELFDEVGELRNLGHCLRNRGDLAQKREQFEEAEQYYRKALVLFLRLKALREAAWCGISLAQVVHAHVSPEEARKLLEQARSVDLGADDKRCADECLRLVTQWCARPT